MKILVIGGVAGGATAAARAKRIVPQAEIELFEAGPYISYGSCGIPYYIAGEIDNLNKLIGFSPQSFAEKKGVKVNIRHRVEEIDRKNKEIIVKDIAGDKLIRKKYDRLVIASGANPFVPPIPNRDLKGVYSLRQLEQGQNLYDACRAEEVKKAVIIGGGAIGTEMAEAMVKLGLEVTLVEKSPQILNLIDADMAEIVAKHLKDKKVRLLNKKAVKSFIGEHQLQAIELDDGEIVECDLALMALGIRPELKLAQEAGLKIGAAGAIWVNRYQQTSADDIFACGDCCETYHLVARQQVWIPLANTANKQGRVAGANVCGVREEFKGVLGTAQIKVLDLDVARTGLSSREAIRYGFDFFTQKINAFSNARYYPDHGFITIKLIVAADGRLLGAQAVGEKGVDKRIDVLALAIYHQMKVDQLQDLDLGYAPPYSSPMDPLIIAGNLAKKKVNNSKS